ncbi:uncharacterized protein METZ01_LOCUS253574 [marine metagenome]|uniref:Uncharacterized protein n=1 Tax=marine metagenome TaxID=408172 RepID=A0A382IM22_9ZZZZ
MITVPSQSMLFEGEQNPAYGLLRSRRFFVEAIALGW